jgi:hypothetical protein
MQSMASTFAVGQAVTVKAVQAKVRVRAREARRGGAARPRPPQVVRDPNN